MGETRERTGEGEEEEEGEGEEGLSSRTETKFDGKNPS